MARGQDGGAHDNDVAEKESCTWNHRPRKPQTTIRRWTRRICKSEYDLQILEQAVPDDSFKTVTDIIIDLSEKGFDSGKSEKLFSRMGPEKLAHDANHLIKAVVVNGFYFYIQILVVATDYKKNSLIASPADISPWNAW